MIRTHSAQRTAHSVIRKVCNRGILYRKTGRYERDNDGIVNW